MILRPQRYRTLLGFLAGLFLSLIIAGAGYFYYQNNTYMMTEQEQMQIRQLAVNEYKQNNPTSLVYRIVAGKKSGEVLLDKDIAPAEISSDLVPADAVTDPSLAIGKVIRCSILSNTIITDSLLYGKQDYPHDMRLVEYTVLNIPQKLQKSEFIDIRIMFPNGLDYIVLSKKQVVDLERPEENQKSIIWFHAGEEEILRMSSAIVDASIVEGTVLYVLPYIAPDIQNEAVRTYPSNPEVQKLILEDPNIISKAVTELETRNRELFEKRIDEDYQYTGRNKVFGENKTVISPDSYEDKAIEAEEVRVEDNL
ncbi:MAG: hypothetical protein GX386_05770 [Clostridiaceae bacterium]|nr:hypothetical protein [Clostridiaceae bacterium]